MTIITQSKTAAINGDITRLYIHDNDIVAEIKGGDAYRLGAYSSKEQAQDVLLDMAAHINDDEPYQLPPDHLLTREWIQQLSDRLDALRQEDNAHE